jgi:cytoskeleton protein RodZ
MGDMMTSETANGDDSGQAATPGEVLRAKREQQGMSVEDVASYLRLSPRQVQALEANDFEALPGLTFVRGFIRNYARLLQLDPQPLMALAPELNPLVQSKPITTASERISYREQQPIFGGKRQAKRKKPVLIAVAVLVVAVIAIAIALRHRHAATRQAPAAAPATPAAVNPPAAGNTPMLPMPPNATPAAPAGASSAPMLPSVPANGATPPAPAAPAQPGPAALNTPASTKPASGGRLNITVKAAAWVKVTDAHGKTVLARLLPAGTHEAIVGVPPLKVTVGNAPSVQMIYNDKPVDLASHISGQVAHLTLE